MNSPVWHNNASKLSTESIMTVVLKYFPCAWAICALAAYCLIIYHKTIWTGNSFWQRLPFIIQWPAQRCSIYISNNHNKSIQFLTQSCVQEIAVCSPSATKEGQKNLPLVLLQHHMGTGKGTERRSLMQRGHEDDGLSLLRGDSLRFNPLWFHLLTKGW